jgi:hypothetical protein
MKEQEKIMEKINMEIESHYPDFEWVEEPFIFKAGPLTLNIAPIEDYERMLEEGGLCEIEWTKEIYIEDNKYVIY